MKRLQVLRGYLAKHVNWLLALLLIMVVAQPDASYRNGRVVITLGPPEAFAAGTADYSLDGLADDVEVLTALNALPNQGGLLHFKAGTYNLTANVTRAIGNVTIEGEGRNTLFTGSGSFIAGGNQWVFRDMALNATTQVDMGATTGWKWFNVYDSATFWTVRDSANGQSVFATANTTTAFIVAGNITSANISTLNVTSINGSTINGTQITGATGNLTTGFITSVNSTTVNGTTGRFGMLFGTNGNITSLNVSSLNISTDVTPSANNTANLGSVTRWFANLWANIISTPTLNLTANGVIWHEDIYGTVTKIFQMGGVPTGYGYQSAVYFGPNTGNSTSNASFQGAFGIGCLNGTDNLSEGNWAVGDAIFQGTNLRYNNGMGDGTGRWMSNSTGANLIGDHIFYQEPSTVNWSSILGGQAFYYTRSSVGDVSLGYQTGYNNGVAGGVSSYNVFIGHQAGYNELSPTNKLYINNAQGGTDNRSSYIYGNMQPRIRTFELGEAPATAGILTQDGQRFTLNAFYWNGSASTTWNATIQHKMIATTPDSYLDFLINGVSALRMRNNNGSMTTNISGNLTLTGSVIAFTNGHVLALPNADSQSMQFQTRGSSTSLLTLMGLYGGANGAASPYVSIGAGGEGYLRYEANHDLGGANRVAMFAYNVTGTQQTLGMSISAANIVTENISGNVSILLRINGKSYKLVAQEQ